jgi:hypothetical protein
VRERCSGSVHFIGHHDLARPRRAVADGVLRSRFGESYNQGYELNLISCQR